MSTTAVPGDLLAAHHSPQLLSDLTDSAVAARVRHPAATMVRRRANQQQGRSLEMVGHAIEYLVDSRLFLTSGLDERAEQEAVQILMRSSRAIFAECAAVVPLSRRLNQWLHRLP